METPGILVIGEALIDIVHRSDGTVDESPGGSPANVALALGRLGRHPRLVTQLADDARGDRIRAWLEESQVSADIVPSARTGTATAQVDPAGSARYELDLSWEVDRIADRGEGIVHTGSIASLLGPGAEAVRAFLGGIRRRALVTYDPNVRPALFPDAAGARRDVEAFVALADVVKASDEDLAWLYPGRSPLDSARSWRGLGPALIVVTEGSVGAHAVTSESTVFEESRSVDVVDTVGAGDTFMSALIHGIVERGWTDAGSRDRLRRLDAETLGSLLRLGAATAAITVSRPGADPPTLSELAAMRAR